MPLRKVADRLLDIAEREAQDPDGVKFTLTEGAALLIAHKSEGSLRDAVSALDQVVSSGEAEVDEARGAARARDRRPRGVLRARRARSSSAIRQPALHALHAGVREGHSTRASWPRASSEHIRHILILKVDPDGADLVAASGED